MQDEFSNLLSRIDELSATETVRLESLAAADPECGELLRFARALNSICARAPEVGFDRSELINYVTAVHFGSHPSRTPNHRFRMVELALKNNTSVQPEVEALFRRLAELDEALPAGAHFEKLSGISLDDIHDVQAVEDFAERGPAHATGRDNSGPTVREPRAHSAGSASHRISRRRVVLMAAPAVLLLAVLGTSVVTTPNAVKFIQREISQGSIGEQVRSQADPVSTEVERFRTDLAEAIESKAGLFPRIDAIRTAELRSEMRNAFPSLATERDRQEVRLLIATVDWALGDQAMAVTAFADLRQGEGSVAQRAREAHRVIARGQNAKK